MTKENVTAEQYQFYKIISQQDNLGGDLCKDKISKIRQKLQNLSIRQMTKNMGIVSPEKKQWLFKQGTEDEHKSNLVHYI